MSRLDYRILGPLEVSDGERPVPLGGPRRRALLGLLLVRANDVVSADRLIDEIWDDHAADMSVNVLHVAIGKLRRALGEGALLTRPPGYVLHVEPERLDATRFSRLVAQARGLMDAHPEDALDVFDEALRLWRGGVLEDLSSEAFVHSAAARLAEERLSALEDRMSVVLELGRHASVVGELEALVAEHPFRERLRAHLMVALYRSGRQADALGVYQSGRALLADELGIDPDPDLQRLEMAILHQDGSLAATPAAAHATARRTQAPVPRRLPQMRALERSLSPTFTGREGEMRVLETALGDAIAGQGRMVIVEGEAGNGKSRLAMELCARGVASGTTVLWGSCIEADLTLPYLPFLEAAGNHLADGNAAALRERLGATARVLAGLLPQLGAETLPAVAGDSPQAKIRFFEAFVALLRAVSEESGMLFVVEDLHWADTSSRELLEYTARRLGRTRILVVATCRKEEMHRRHPLVPSLQGWLRSGVAELVRVPPLDPLQMTSLVASMLPGAEVDENFRDYLWERSEGNPLIVEEMLRDAIERGVVFRTAHGWSHHEVARLGVPRLFADAVLRRLDRLGAEHIQVLQSAAVLGSSFDVGVLGRMIDIDAVRLATVVEDCVARLIVTPGARPGSYRFRHAMTRDAVYEDTGLESRAALHREAADALRAGSRPAMEIAGHLWAAGLVDAAVPETLRAAEDAVSAHAHGEAVALYERVLPHIGDAETRGRVLCRLGAARHLAANARAAVGALEDGVAALAAAGRVMEGAAYRLRLGRCYWETGRPDLAHAEYELARSTLEPLGASGPLADAYIRMAGMHVFQREGVPARILAERALEVANAAGAHDARIWATGTIGLALCCHGDLDAGLAALDESFVNAVARGLADVAELVMFHSLCYRAYWARGSEVPDRLARLRSLTPTPAQRSYVLRVETLYGATSGDLRRAHESASALADFEGAVGVAWAAPSAKTLLAGVLSEMGRTAEGLDILPDPGSERLERIGDSWIRLQLHLAAGDIDRAAATAELFLDPQPWDRLPFLVDGAVEALVAAERVDDAARVITLAGEPFEVRPAAPWRALSTARILYARSDVAAARALARDAAAAFAAAGALMDEARALELLARTEAAAGDAEAASSSLRRVCEAADARGAGRHRRIADAIAREIGVELVGSRADVVRPESPR